MSVILTKAFQWRSNLWLWNRNSVVYFRIGRVYLLRKYLVYLLSIWKKIWYSCAPLQNIWYTCSPFEKGSGISVLHYKIFGIPFIHFKNIWYTCSPFERGSGCFQWFKVAVLADQPDCNLDIHNHLQGAVLN